MGKPARTYESSTAVLPTVGEMVADLLNSGWRRRSQTTWVSPRGSIFRGPYGAWKAMTDSKRKEAFAMFNHD